MGSFLLQQSKSFYFNNKKIWLNGVPPLIALLLNGVPPLNSFTVK